MQNEHAARRMRLQNSPRVYLSWTICALRSCSPARATQVYPTLLRHKTLSKPASPDDRMLRNRATARRRYAKRKALGLCANGGCQRAVEPPHTRCPLHLRNMSQNYCIYKEQRKAQGLCVYCGMRPQFWGVRCVICRQFVKRKDELPAGMRRALRLYRKAEEQRELELMELEVRFAIRKLLATGSVSGDDARALRLYAGLDRGGWRTYSQVGKLMRISSERVRQLLYPSKVILTEILAGHVPWRPLK